VTHTLHRDGDAASFGDDYILLAIPAKGHNDEGAVEKLRTFLRICAATSPSTWANGTWAPITFTRLPTPDYEKVSQASASPTAWPAEFDSKESW